MWCPSAYTRLIDSVLIDALRIFTGCLRPTPTDHLLILSGIQPDELRQAEASLSLLSLAYREFQDPDHIHRLLSKSSDACQERLRSRRLYVTVLESIKQICRTGHSRFLVEELQIKNGVF